MNKDLIFTATYNEADNISTFLDSVLKIPNIDILIIDDNSPDRTGDIIKQYQNNNKNLFLVSRDGKEGLDSAHKIGFNFAKDKVYENLITLDADLSHDPNMIPLFLKTLEDKPFVIGSRYILGGKCLMKGSRLIMSKIGNKVIKFFSGINCNEFTTSYRGFNIEKLENFHLNNVKENGYSFFMGTLFEINKKKFAIKEIPITFADREKGISKIPKLEIFRTLKNLIVFIFKKNK